MRRKKRVVAIILLSILAIFAFISKQRDLSRWFVDYPLPLKETSRLFDMGIVDANGDNLLDIYTSNHHFRQSLLIADGQGGYHDVLSEWGLDQSHEFPLAELSFIAPVVDKPGLYIYWYGTTLVIKAHKTNETGTWRGSLLVNDPVEIVKKDSFHIQKLDQASPFSQTVIEFSTSTDGKLVMRPGGQGLPFSFQLDDNTSASNVYVGRGKVSPKSSNFSLTMQDRHAMAWADYNGDDLLDVFISRGALGGTLRAHSESVSLKIKDELLVSQGLGKFVDMASEVGIDKKDCSGRHARWLDFNKDGLLDLYINCYNRNNVLGDYPKQLYQQDKLGQFHDIALELGLGMSDQQIGSFAWIDVDNDGDIDLVTYQNEGFFLYRNHREHFSQEHIHRLSLTGEGRIGNTTGSQWLFDGKLAIADYDKDGDLDIFSASKRGNILLSNQNGKYAPIEPSSVGLPAVSLTANWLDFDNDGRFDLYTVPQGLYRHNREHGFEPTGLLAFPREQFKAAIANWFDLDNDGRLDLLLALNEDQSFKHWWEFSPKKKRRSTWLLKTYRNVGAHNHWLQVKLIGGKNNRQGIGSRVIVITPDGEQVQEVGNTDGAFFSQGHFRLYFGLGDYAKADAIKIRWSDGYQQEVTNVTSDKLTVVKRDDIYR